MMQRPLRKDRSSNDRWLVVALLGALAGVVMPLGSFAGQPAAAQQSDGPGALALQEAAPEEWLTYGRDQAETHYSPLNQINSDNIDRLGLAWSWEIPKAGNDAAGFERCDVRNGTAQLRLRSRCPHWRENMAVGPRNSRREERGAERLLRGCEPGARDL